MKSKSSSVNVHFCHFMGAWTTALRVSQVPQSTHLERGDVLGVEVVLDVADDAARLAHAPLAQQHDLEVVAAAASSAVTRGRGGERHVGWGGDHS